MFCIPKLKINTLPKFQPETIGQRIQSGPLTRAFWRYAFAARKALEPSPPHIPGYADFTTFTEVDNVENNIIVNSALSVSFDFGSLTAYLYKDTFAGFFVGDFTHYFDLYYEAGDSGSAAYVWILTHIVASKTDDMGNCLFFRLSQADAYLFEKYNGTYYPSANRIYPLPTDKTYYITITRVGSTLTLRAYNDSARTSQYGDTLSLSLHSVEDYRYIYAIMNLYTGLPYWRGTLENLWY